MVGCFEFEVLGLMFGVLGFEFDVDGSIADNGLPDVEGRSSLRLDRARRAEA